MPGYTMKKKNTKKKTMYGMGGSVKKKKTMYGMGGLTGAQKTLPKALQDKITKSKSKTKKG